MRTPVEERELVVSGYTYDPDGSRAKNIEVYTSDYTMMAKFDRFCEENPEEWKIIDTMTCQGDIVGREYRFPVKCLTFRAKTATRRELTEEQKKAHAERLKRNLQRTAK